MWVNEYPVGQWRKIRLSGLWLSAFVTRRALLTREVTNSQYPRLWRGIYRSNQPVEWVLIAVTVPLSLISPKEPLMTAKHILVPTDFSAYAEQALDYAISLAQVLQARLTLLHVIHLTPLALGDIDASSLVPYLEAIETDAQQGLQASLERVHQKGLEGEAAMIQGVPFQTIIDAARDHGVDLIVMGTHGRTGLTHVFMGSVAEKVVRLAPCPVLVTRGTTEDAGA
jgi:nucleotide-binding universal stress UspA family protein